MTKKTVGSQARDLLLKAPETRDPIEIQREAQKDYIDNLEWTVRHMQKKVDCSDLVGKGRGHETCKDAVAHMGDFFVVVLTKRERVVENILRNYFMATMSCPTPDYNQSVYKYHANREQLEYIWTVPDQEVCETFAKNARYVIPDERALLEFVMQFYDGTLLKKARELNGENLETGIVLEKK